MGRRCRDAAAPQVAFDASALARQSCRRRGSKATAPDAFLVQAIEVLQFGDTVRVEMIGTRDRRALQCRESILDGVDALCATPRDQAPQLLGLIVVPLAMQFRRLRRDLAEARAQVIGLAMRRIAVAPNGGAVGALRMGSLGTCQLVMMARRSGHEAATLVTGWLGRGTGEGGEAQT